MSYTLDCGQVLGSIPGKGWQTNCKTFCLPHMAIMFFIVFLWDYTRWDLVVTSNQNHHIIHLFLVFTKQALMSKFAFKTQKRGMKQQQQFLAKKVISFKINPEGTGGPIWLEVVPLFRISSWLYCGMKKIVD